MASHPRLASFFSLVAIAASSAAIAPASAQCEVSETHKLLRTAGGSHQKFGWSVAVAGDLVVVGAPQVRDYQGDTTVFRLGDGAPLVEGELTPEVQTPGHWFGSAVATDGATIVVSAPYHLINERRTGAAFVFRPIDGLWTQTATLSPSDGTGGENFGHRVAVQGDLIVASAPWSDDGGEGTGAVYVYRCVDGDWIEEAKLQSESRPPMTYFGRGLDLDGARIAVGVGEDNETGYGAAFVFLHDGEHWIQEAHLELPDPDFYDQLGFSVALEGDLLVAGARGDDDNGEDAGAAYAFIRTTMQWRLDEKILAADGHSGDRFGGDVALSGGRLLVAARDYPGSGRIGTAYLFATAPGTYWSEVLKTLASDGAWPDTMGFSIDLSGDVAVAGAPYQSQLEGAAYVFDTSCPPCVGDLDGDDVVGPSDLLVVLAAWGPCGGECPEDLDGDGCVGFGDVVLLLFAWGPCEDA